METLQFRRNSPFSLKRCLRYNEVVFPLYQNYCMSGKKNAIETLFFFFSRHASHAINNWMSLLEKKKKTAGSGRSLMDMACFLMSKCLCVSY